MPPILLLLQLIAFDDEMDVAEVDHFTYCCDVSATNSIDVAVCCQCSLRSIALALCVGSSVRPSLLSSCRSDLHLRL